jgi:hypothetical protein
MIVRDESEYPKPAYVELTVRKLDNLEAVLTIDL